MTKLAFDTNEVHFKHWKIYNNFEGLIVGSVVDGLEILVEAARCEPFQHENNMFHEYYVKHIFMKQMVKKSTELYPLLMARAMKLFLEMPYAPFTE